MFFQIPSFWFYFPQTPSKNPVIFADLLNSCHSFKRGIRDKISTKRWLRRCLAHSRMSTNDANYLNLGCHTIRVFSLNYSDCALFELDAFTTSCARKKITPKRLQPRKLKHIHHATYNGDAWNIAGHGCGWEGCRCRQVPYQVVPAL